MPRTRISRRSYRSQLERALSDFRESSVHEQLDSRDVAGVAAALATSSGVPSLPSGVAAAMNFRRSSPTCDDASRLVRPGVLMDPGLIAFTQAIEIAELGHVARDAGYVLSDLPSCLVQLCRTARGYEEV